MENQDLKESVLLNLRSVTQSCKGGVPFERLQRDYKDLLGSAIPFRELGYKSLEDFIRDIPHVIALRRDYDGKVMAEGVADASTAHIVSLVSRQKTESKKRGFRRPPPHIGMRRTLSTRYTFREGPRSVHSRYKSSPPHYPPKNFPPKPRSPPPPRVSSQPKPQPAPSRVSSSNAMPPAPVQHSRSRPSNNTQVPIREKFDATPPPPPREKYVVTPPPPPPKEKYDASLLPRGKYEIAPRFLKLQSQKRNPSPPPPQEFVSSPTHAFPLPQPTYFPEEVHDVIPPPRPSVRSLPSRPQRIDNSRVAQLGSLESARTAKDYVEVYSKMENMSIKYTTLQFGQKAKNKGYVSTLALGDKKYQSYPVLKPTKEEAEEVVASKAMAAIKERMKEQMALYPETPYGNAEEIRKLLARIEEIVCEKPSGMYENGIVREYEDKFNERLPCCWPDLLKQSGNVEIDEVALLNVKVPKGANFIVRPTKELSSGNRTPSSTSSKTEADITYEDLDTIALKKNLVKISLPQVPDYELPSGNIWDVFVTNVSGWFSVRLLDYNDDFLTLSEDMKEFYGAQKFPVMEVHEYQVYAACVDGNLTVWHRVLVEEIKEDGQISCYLVDEGDFTYVKKENLQEISPQFLELPYQAIHISLDGLEAYENCIKYELLEKKLLGQTLIGEIKRCNQVPEFFPDIAGVQRTVYSVILYDTSDSSGEDLNLNEWLKQSVVESLVCKLPKLLTSSCAYLSHVTSDGYVYLRFTNPAHCWIEQELEKHAPVFEEASSSSSACQIPSNTMCVVKHESGSWHRATISEYLQIDDETELMDVYFVDYGHMGVGSFEICELEPISELLASIHPQVVCCNLLNALPSPTSKWTEAETAKLLRLAPFDQELIIRVMSEGDEKNPPKVNLYKRNQDANIISINDSLAFVEELGPPSVKVPSKLPLQPRKTSFKTNLSGAIPDVAVSAEEQMAKRLGGSVSTEDLKWVNTPDDIKTPGAFEVLPPVSLSLPIIPEADQYFDVFVTMAAHPHNFVVQPFASSQELNKLMKDMLSFYSNDENQLEIDMSMLRINDFYAALHSDGSWYRVRVQNIIPGDPVQVAAQYVDFGDFHTVYIGNLQHLYQNFKQLPCQAIQASLAGIRPFECDWDPVHCVKFREMVTEKAFVSTIRKKQTQMKDNIPTLLVELILTDTSSQKDIYIHEQLIEKQMARPL